MAEWVEAGFMRFVKAKKAERAHVFRPVSSTAELMESLCGRWLTRAYHSTTGAAMLVPADGGLPRCKRCEKKWAELNGNSIQA